MKQLAKILMILCMILVCSAFASAYVNNTMLTVSKVTIWVDGDKEDVSEFEEIDANPGSEIKLQVELKNEYANSDDEIENIELELVASSLDEDEEDYEDDAEIDDIKGTRDDDVKFETFTIGFDADEGSNTVTIDITADCPNSTDVCNNDFEFSINVEKEKHELTMTSASVSPDTMTCNGYATLSFKIYNTGREDEEEVVIEASNSALGIDFKDIVDLDTCPDDDCIYSKSIEINAKDGQAAGTYPIAIKAVYDDGDETLTKTVNLVTEACIVEDEEEETEPVTVDIIDSIPETQQPVVVAPVESNTWYDQNKYMIWVGLAYVVVIAAIILIAVALFRKK